MNDNQVVIVFALIIFGIMFIAHTISDYNLITDTKIYCAKVSEKKNVE